MYAIVEIAGQQFKVQKDQKVYVHRLEAEEGSKVEFDQVLLLEDKGTVSVGAPAVVGAKVTAKVENHVKGDKVIAWSKKVPLPLYVRYGWKNFLTPNFFNKEGLPASSFSSINNL